MVVRYCDRPGCSEIAAVRVYLSIQRVYPPLEGQARPPMSMGGADLCVGHLQEMCAGECFYRYDFWIRPPTLS